MRYYKPKWESMTPYADLVTKQGPFGFWSGINRGKVLVIGDVRWINVVGLAITSSNVDRVTIIGDE